MLKVAGKVLNKSTLDVKFNSISPMSVHSQKVVSCRQPAEAIGLLVNDGSDDHTFSGIFNFCMAFR